MEKIKVEYEKLYYGFPVVLISYYDQEGKPNITTLSSSYSLKDMMVLGFNSKGFAIKQLQKVSDFVVNIVDSKLMAELEICGKHTGLECNKFVAAGLTPIPSEMINAPVIAECPISIECTLTDVVESASFSGIINLIAKIKGRLVSKEYLDENSRIVIPKFDNITYYGDGKTRGFREYANEI